MKINPHGHYAALPNLRIVPIDSVLPHEQHDHQRSEPLIKRILEAGVWLNPPMVSPIPDESERYVVLDGANRCFSAKSLGFPHILVQVVDYEQDVTLETWNHVLSDCEADAFLPQIYKIPGLHAEATTAETAEAALDLQTAVAYLHLLPNRFLMLVADKQDIHTRSHKLRALVDTYKTVARINRINHEDPEVIRQLYPTACAVVVFPHYTPSDIIDAAVTGVYLPPGISRHIISGRAMRLHYPLPELSDPHKSTAQKNADLLKWMQTQAANKRIRLYEEATYVFDD